MRSCRTSMDLAFYRDEIARLDFPNDRVFPPTRTCHRESLDWRHSAATASVVHSRMRRSLGVTCRQGFLHATGRRWRAACRPLTPGASQGQMPLQTIGDLGAERQPPSDCQEPMHLRPKRRLFGDRSHLILCRRIVGRSCSRDYSPRNVSLGHDPQREAWTRDASNFQSQLHNSLPPRCANAKAWLNLRPPFYRSRVLD